MTRAQTSTAIFCLVGGWMAILVVFVLVWLIRSYSRTKLNNHSNWLVEPGETSTEAVDIKFAPGESLHASCQIDFCPSLFFEKFFSKELYLTNQRIILVRRPRSGTRQIRSILFSEIQNVEIAETSPHVKLLLKSGEVYQIAHVQHGHIQDTESRDRITDFFKRAQDF